MNEVRIDMNRHDKIWLATSIGFFATIAIVGRLFPHEYNFVAFGGLALFCGSYLRGFTALVVPLAVYLASEVLGRLNGLPGMSVSLLLWILAGYSFQVMIGKLGGKFTRIGESKSGSMLSGISAVIVAAMIGSIGFFVITNFAAWLDPRMGYPRTFAGLISAYLSGLPFYRWTLIGDVFFGLAFFSSYYGLIQLQPRLQSERHP